MALRAPVTLNGLDWPHLGLPTLCLGPRTPFQPSQGPQSRSSDATGYQAPALLLAPSTFAPGWTPWADPRLSSWPHHVWDCQSSLLVCPPRSLSRGTVHSRGEHCPHQVTFSSWLIPPCGAALLTRIGQNNFQFIHLLTTSSWNKPGKWEANPL